MTLANGTRLGPYEVLSAIGAGGMGEVWRAKDTRLDRDVAIKVLPASFAKSAQLRSRFDREAKAISALNHPHICTLHDVGHHEGIDYLVMEMIDGESLADRLRKGPLPLEQVLRYGQQIAMALDSAHRHGIVHRDLKPGNIMLTKSGAKLLDFGLAKNQIENSYPEGHTDMVGATAHKPLTQEGTILGTFQYMAPEQLEGQEADARTDIFALGCVLYEMATGRRAFEGATRTSLIAAIVTAQPAPISSVTDMAPPALDHVVRKCLEKAPDDRWHSAHDIATELQWISQAGSQAGVATTITLRRKSRERLAWALALLFAVTATAFGIGYLRRAPKPRPAVRASIAPAAGTALIPFDELGFALSPDGRQLAYVAQTNSGEKQIWIRDLASNASKPLAETQGAWYPFWSPDNRSLGFFANGKLKRIDLRGGAPVAIADAPSGRGGSWGADDTILYAPNLRTAIHAVPATGGTPRAVTKYDPQRETTHRWPLFLPGGKQFFYLSRTRKAEKSEVGRLMLASLENPEGRLLIDDSTNAVYVQPGYVIYGRSGNLFAQRFDLAKLQLVGAPVAVIEEKLSFWEPKNLIPFTASDDGTLVYLADTSRKTTLQWFDRNGRQLGTIGTAGYLSTPRISGDGKRVATMRWDDHGGVEGDLWIHDVESTRSFRFTFRSGIYNFPTFSPDQSTLLFTCQPAGVPDLCIKPIGKAGDVSVLHESANWKLFPLWSRDGKAIYYTEQNPDTNNDILVIPVQGDASGKRTPKAIVKTPFNEISLDVSPDGRWLAYGSDESGRGELYIRTLDGPPGEWQISTTGAMAGLFHPKRNELFFVTMQGELMSVTLDPGDGMRPSTPVLLFRFPEGPDNTTPLLEAVSPDGERLLVNLPVESRSSISFQTILNWTSLLK